MAVAEEGDYHYVVFFWVEGAVWAYQPFVVTDGAAVPGWVDDGWEGGMAEGFVGQVGGGDEASILEGEVT